MRGVMLDIETYGDGPDAMVRAIGAVDTDGAEFYRVISSATATGTLSPSTMLWWMRQSDAARHEFTNHPGTPSTAETEVIADLSEFLIGPSYTTDELWSNSPSFDCVIVSSMYARHGFRFPVRFSKWRDLRTIRAQRKSDGHKVERYHPVVAHTALDDARAQMQELLS